jgi:hypothetical protein
MALVLGSGWAWALTAEQEAKLTASDAADRDEFGRWLAIDGATALIGGAEDDDNGSGSGSVYVFVRGAGGWTEQGKLLAADGAVGDQFGWGVALDGDTAVVGAFRDDDNGSASGSAYVFTRVGNTWSQQAKLLPADGEVGDRFGSSVAIDGDTAVVSAPQSRSLPVSRPSARP